MSEDAPALSGALLYAWLAIYAAYFFPIRQAVFQLVLMCAAYLAVLVATVPAADVVASWITLAAVLGPIAVVLRIVRGGVTQLVRSLSEAARTDPLTRLKNRLALDQEIDEQLEVARRAERSLTVVVGDLDHFKYVNDQLGHRAGDRALVRIARILLSHRRAGDTVARTGGEEFTLLLPNTSEHDAFLAAERMRIAVAEEFAADPVPVTFSFGVATFPDHGPSADAVIESGDQALYAAKALGRNRSIIFNREVSSIFAPEAGGRGLDAAHLPELLSLTEALDIRDAGTANHSRTVGRLCALIAEQLGFDPDHVERVGMAGRAARHRQDRRAQRRPAEAGPARRRRDGPGPHPPRDRGGDAGRAGPRGPAQLGDRSPRAPRWQGLPAAAGRPGDPARGQDHRRRGRVRGDDSDRVYRPGIGNKAARVELLRCAGTQFDARVIAGFMAVLDTIERAPDPELAGLRP